jgi:hypothetical protein
MMYRFITVDGNKMNYLTPTGQNWKQVMKEVGKNINAHIAV